MKNERCHFRRWILAMMLGITLGGGASRFADAQDSQPSGETRLHDWSGRFQRYEVDKKDPRRGVFTAVEAVNFRYGRIHVRCDNLVIWFERTTASDSDPLAPSTVKPIEIYAEGLVIYRRDQEVVVCHRVFLDVVHDRGIFDEATLSTSIPFRNGDLDLVMRASELRQLDQAQFEGRNVSISTCAFGEPHWHMKTASMSVATRERPADGERPGVREVAFDLDSTVLYAGSMPVFALPPISGTAAAGVRQQFGFVKSVDLDTSGRFGPSIRVGLGDDIYIDDERWGDYTISPQYLGDRGPGLGADVKYRTKDYHGEFEALYQNDHGIDKLFGEPPQDDRGRVKLQHRQYLPEHIQADLEVSYISDEGFLPEYYENEFKSEKEQETLLYLKRAVDNRALTFLAKGRINDFQDQTEYLPQLGYNVINEPLFDIGDFTTLYFDADYEGAYVRRRYNRRLGLGDDETYRVDLDQKIIAPISAGPVKIAPFAGLRYTRYGRHRLVEDPVNRIGEVYGVSLFTELSKTYRVEGGPLDLFGLRHIVMPEVTYEAVQHVSVSAKELYQFDGVDALAEEEKIRFGLRNRFQTIWTDKNKPEVVDVIDLDVEWNYFPQASRDNFGEHAGNLEVDFAFKPSRRLMLVNDFEYSFVLDDLEVFNVAAIVAPSDEVQFVTGYRRYIGVNDAVFAQVNWRMSERWEIGLYTGIDFVENRWQDQRLMLRRIGHDWVISFQLTYNQGDNDIGFGMSFAPRALFDPRLKSSFIRTQPEFGSFDDHLVR